MNKIAQLGSQMMIFAFLFLLFVIGVGIVIGISIFFGEEYEFRKVDADILNYKLRECISQKDINWDLAQDEIEKEIFEKCNLNEAILKQDFTISIKLNGEIKYNLGVASKCSLSEKNKEFPKCTESNVVKNINGDSKTFSILAGSEQNIREKIT